MDMIRTQKQIERKRRKLTNPEAMVIEIKYTTIALRAMSRS